MAHDIPAWFAGKTLEELNAIEVAGRVLIPDALNKIGPKGEPISVPVLVRVPSEGERARGRMEAIKLVAERYLKQMGRDPEKHTVERARIVIGAEVFEDLDTYAIVAQSLFEPRVDAGKPTPAFLLSVLYDSYPKSSIFDIYDRIEFYAKLFNPRMDNLSDEQFWGCVEAIARVRNLSPLVGISGSEQTGCITRMAVELSNSRKLKFSLPSTEISTPDG